LTLHLGTAFSVGDVEGLTIGRLADEAGVNVETIRYYERRGLLREPPRTEAGYRQYSTSDLWRLQFIARAKRLGFTLTEIAALTGPDGGGSAEHVLALAGAKIQALDDQQHKLADTRSRLEQLVELCDDPTSEDCMALRI
jgi:DNA-binding transcriptional MerR regulator